MLTCRPFLYLPLVEVSVLIESRASRTLPNLPLLRDLLAPLELAVFERDYWEQQPLHVQHGESNRFGHLMRFDALDTLLALLENNRDLFLVNHDRTMADVALPDDQKPNPQMMFDCFSRGYSVVVNEMQDKWAPVQALSRRLAHETGFANYINMYVTPPDAVAFDPHWDCEDVLVLQLEGEKQWFLFAGGPELPYVQQGGRADTYNQLLEQPGQPVRTLTLAAGDVLYLPRGWGHQAAARDQASMHLTIALRTPTWADYLIEAVRQQAAEEIALRRTLPLGWHCQDAATLHRRMPDVWRTPAAEAAAPIQTGLKKRLFTQTAPPHDGLFAQLDALNTLTAETWLEKRHGDMFTLENHVKSMCLTYPGFDCHGPTKLGWALESVLSQARFQPAMLPAFLSASERLTFCRHLLRRGFLRVVQDKAGAP